MPCMVEMCRFDLGDVEANLEKKQQQKCAEAAKKTPGSFEVPVFVEQSLFCQGSASVPA